MNDYSKELPITILITSYNRKELLQKTIDSINKRTFYPYRIIIIDNNSTDGSIDWIKNAKVNGLIFDHVFMPENLGQSEALNEGFRRIEFWENEKRRPSSNYFVTTNDDIYPPMYEPENCWLKQMLNLLKDNEPEYGGIAMRIQRLPRTEINEYSEIIPFYKGFPSVFRLLKRDDFRALGDTPFGRLKKWDGNTCGETFKTQIKKKFGFTTHIYADHAGFIKRKGYEEGVQTFTLADNKLTESDDKPYPDINPITNEPVKINHGVDIHEQLKRENYNIATTGKHVGANIAILILTCKRLGNLQRLINSIYKTVDKNIRYELLIIADNDDTEAYQYCLDHNIKCILSSYHRDFVANANLGSYIAESSLIIKFDDDMELLEPGWLNRALDSYNNRFKDKEGLLCFNDGISHGSVFTTGIYSKKLLYTLGGHLFFPAYKHYGSDREIVGILKNLNLYYYDESITVKHHHWQSDESVAEDDTYKISKNKFWRFDQTLKKNRQTDQLKLIENKNYYDYE